MSVLLAGIHYGITTIYSTDKIDERLKAARKSGCHWTGNPDKTDIVKEILQLEPYGLDIVFECCGKQEAMDQAVTLLKPGGRIIIVGIPEFDTWTLNTHEIRRKEITIINIRRQVHCTEEALDLIDKDLLDVSSMHTHTFNYRQSEEAFELVSGYRDGGMKAMIEFD